MIKKKKVPINHLMFEQCYSKFTFPSIGVIKYLIQCNNFTFNPNFTLKINPKEPQAANSNCAQYAWEGG